MRVASEGAQGVKRPLNANWPAAAKQPEAACRFDKARAPGPITGALTHIGEPRSHRRSHPLADRRPGMMRPSMPYPTGTPWRTRNPSTHAVVAPRSRPGNRRPSHAHLPSGRRLSPRRPTGPLCALVKGFAGAFLRWFRSPQSNRRAVEFPIPPAECSLFAGTGRRFRSAMSGAFQGSDPFS